MRKLWIVCVLMVGVTGGSLFGQQSTTGPGESHKYRTILTLAGGGGGFAVGLLAGLAAFDDSVNSDRKVWTTAVLSGAGGAIGGYFLGRALDKSRKSATVTRNADLHGSLMSSERLVLGASDVWTSARPQEWALQSSKQGVGGHWTSQTRTPIPHLDCNRLYLVSALRRIEAAAD